MSEFKANILEWSRNVVAYCHEVAMTPEYDMDLSFYAFQSLPKEQPELLILGINPAEQFSYADQYENPVWHLTEAKQMTPEVLLAGNPFYHEHKNWTIWKNLQKSFAQQEMQQILEESMYMNFVYFNSPNIEDLLNRRYGATAFKKCAEFSLGLITRIVKPKNILCLGTAGCFDYLPITSNGDSCLLRDSRRLLLKGKLDDIKAFGIPHPSGAHLADKKRVQIGEILKHEILGK
ncbi:hypothetical protein [uncultured Sunxiuqinia sp.]|uniref:hypothetical protein n=1 Tax=uncultured Sunxiuqinia sp. TaxID=1573825 RepID=UPI002612244D|nr:hypothetical protein [uncultured Sunxiuqinia sp.]